MREVADAAPDGELVATLRCRAAAALHAEEVERCHLIGDHGAALIPDGGAVLTHCNAGALATGGYGTALGVIRSAHSRDPSISVWVDETRPLLQGARLTAWELVEDGIPATLVTDSMAGWLMAAGTRPGRGHRGRPDRRETATRRTRSAPMRCACSPAPTACRSTSPRRRSTIDPRCRRGRDDPDRAPRPVARCAAARPRRGDRRSTIPRST